MAAPLYSSRTRTFGHVATAHAVAYLFLPFIAQFLYLLDKRKTSKQTHKNGKKYAKTNSIRLFETKTIHNTFMACMNNEKALLPKLKRIPKIAYPFPLPIFSNQTNTALARQQVFFATKKCAKKKRTRNAHVLCLQVSLRFISFTEHNWTEHNRTKTPHRLPWQSVPPVNRPNLRRNLKTDRNKERLRYRQQLNDRKHKHSRTHCLSAKTIQKQLQVRQYLASD